MKEQLKIRKTWLQISVCVGVALLICLGLFGMTYLNPEGMANIFSFPEYLLVICGLIFFAFGFYRVDRFKNKYRRKNKLWAGPLPPEILYEANKIRTAPYMAALITLILAVLINFLFYSGVIIR